MLMDAVKVALSTDENAQILSTYETLDVSDDLLSDELTTEEVASEEVFVDEFSEEEFPQ